MAVTATQTNNKLVQYTRQINREYVRENLFSPYMSADVNAIIRLRMEPKSGGEQMNIPFVTRLAGRGKGNGTLVGNEEKIDNYGMRVWIDWARHAVVTTKAERHKDSADIFGEARPLLADWGKELQRDELIEALMALPAETAPTGLGSDDGDRVNGVRYEAATATQRNAWTAANADRVLFGNAVGNYNATHATALATVSAATGRLGSGSLSLMKRLARNASPRIRPYRLTDGREYFVAFAGSYTFRDLKASLDAVNRDARPREGGGMDKNPLFQDGDLLYDGVIVREVPEIGAMAGGKWATLATAGAASGRVEPVFFCGQQAAVFAWGQMAKPTFRKEDDYGFVDGVGTEMAYGVSKMFRKPAAGANLVQWGLLTGFFAAAADA